MKLTICKNLNIRAGKPSLTAPVTGSKKPSELIEIDTVIYGDVIEGNGIWYKSTNGSLYYWSGGVKETNFLINNATLSNYTDTQQFEILQLLKQSSKGILKREVKGYLGCGIGRKNHDIQGPLSFLIYVDQKVPFRYLDNYVLREVNFKGIKINVDVIEAGNPKHHSGTIPVGYGITDKIEVGTISLRVYRKNNNEKKFFLLTCYHVLCSDLLDNNIKEYNNSSKKAYFPLPLNEDSLAYDVCEGSYSDEFDYAAIELPSENVLINLIDANIITGYFNYGELYSLIGKMVKTVGNVSSLQQGQILDIMDITLDPYNQEFSNVISCQKISTTGDSGAPVIETESKKLIGFIIGGDEKNFSYVLPFYNLNYEKNFFI